ncbi:MAG: HD domain-containing protein [Dysgonamonadaceae bacterium]|jgi:uncharacterized protein|nr:HD domain-containing protein [Dysgonamonadaceae bacterium]
MDPIEIINKYYENGMPLRGILLTHSLSVANKSLEIIKIHPEWTIDKDFIYEAALLHDIGIFKTYAPSIHCFGKYPYICHGYLGAELLNEEGYRKHALVCERHTGSGLTKEDVKLLPLPYKDMLPESLEEKLICFADKFYSKSNLNETKSIDQIRKNLSKYGEDSLTRFDDLVKLFLG